MAGLFEFTCPVKIISGHKALSNLPYEMEQLGAEKALLITDKGVVKAGLLKKVKQAMEGAAVKIAAVFQDTPVDSSNKVVNQVADLFNEKGCDCLIALGGGSSIDTAKGVNIVVSEKARDLMQFQGADRLKGPYKPFIVIPTTAGTGSEVTAAAVIRDVEKDVKMPFVSDKLYPSVAINDPEMTMTMPPKITAATGMDALTHACESFYCLQKNPVSDAFAKTAVRLIFENLETCVKSPKDAQARLNMLNGATCAGIAFSNSMVGIVHGLAHAAGGVAHVPHGVANAIFLAHGMEYNLDKAAMEIGDLYDVVNVENPPSDERERAEKVIEAIRELGKRLNKLCGLPVTLKEAGVTEDQLEEIAKATINDGSLAYNPEEVTLKDALDLVKRAF